jgi:hypothetical protein
VGHLRPGQRVGGSAGLRRASGPPRAAPRRTGELGRRLPAGDPPGHGDRDGRRPAAHRRPLPGRGPRDPRRRRAGGPGVSRGGERPASRPPRGSPPTNWPRGCSSRPPR